MSKWTQYHERVAEKPNSLVVSILEKFVTGKSACIDLGAGNLRDSKFLLAQGFERVVAVDKSEESLGFISDGIELHIMPIEEYEIEKDTFDFVFSCNTLFFLAPYQIALLFRKILAGLRPGGIFTCNVLGMEDQWVVTGGRVSAFTEPQIKALCKGFKILDIGDIKYIAESEHPKFWHLWSIVVKKP